MSTWSDLKKTREYDQAKEEVNQMISKRIAPLEMEIGRLRRELDDLKGQVITLG